MSARSLMRRSLFVRPPPGTLRDVRQTLALAHAIVHQHQGTHRSRYGVASLAEETRKAGLLSVHFPRDPETYYPLGYCGITLDSEESPLAKGELAFYLTQIPALEETPAEPWREQGLESASSTDADEESAERVSGAQVQQPLPGEVDVRRGAMRIKARPKLRLNDIARYIGLRQTGPYRAPAEEPPLAEAEVKVSPRTSLFARRRKNNVKNRRDQVSFEGFYSH